MSQPLIPLQQMAEPLLDVQEMQIWLEKAVVWGQADSPDAQKDTCLHLSRLRDFLRQLLTYIHNTVSGCRQKLNSYLCNYSMCSPCYNYTNLDSNASIQYILYSPRWLLSPMKLVVSTKRNILQAPHILPTTK